MKKILVIPDIHFPYEDKPAINCVLSSIKQYKPDEIVLLGDLVDFYKVSHYVKTDSRALSVQEECDIAHSFLSILRKICPGKITLIEGNHENRLIKFLSSRSPELSDIRGLTLKSLLRLDELKINLIKYNHDYILHGIHFIHGTAAGKTATRSCIAKYGTNTIQGHTHRVSSVYTTYKDRIISAHEIGCLASLEVSKDYTDHADWQHGFCTIDIIDGKTFINPHLIVNGITFINRIINGNTLSLWS